MTQIRDAVDLLDFPKTPSHDSHDEDNDAINDFDDFTHSASAVAISKETKHGNLVETKGTIAKHANPGAIEAIAVDSSSILGEPTDETMDTANTARVVPLEEPDTSIASELEELSISPKGALRFVTAKDFDLLKVIGMGAFGKVLQVRHKYTSRILAMKVISKRLLLRKSGYVENIQAERHILTRVRSPFVVTMHCSFQTKEKLFIIMDFLAGGELFLRLGREGIFLENTAAFYLGEIILAIDHLHSLGILHRDLKPGNDGHVCVTDFGLAKDFSNVGGFNDEENRALTICGTQEYMAPEMLSGQGYGRSADYWSLGCIAFEMLAGLPPFKSKDGRKELFRKIMSEKVKMPSGSSAEACKLLKGLLNRDVQKRLGAVKSTMFEVGGVSALKNEPFFGHLNWDDLANRQTEPPQILSVQNDHDLKHFHQEFTDMALPRSVVLMSKDNFQAHHVESQRFRGFSFIHDSFDLPERPHEELETYWKSIEEDAVSLSDCASSKMENDTLDQLLVESPVKKRPPRNRKKNKADALCSTPAASVQSSPVPSVIATPAQSEIGGGGDVLSLEQEEMPAQTFINEPQRQNISRREKLYVSPLAETKKVAVDVALWQSVGQSRISSEHQSTSATTDKSNKWLGLTSINHETNKTSWNTRNHAPSSHPQPWNHSKQPGSMARETIPITNSRSLRPQTAHETRHMQPPPPLVNPSAHSDWRHHSMSLRKQASMDQQSQSHSIPSWPSLGDKQDNTRPSVGKTPSATKPTLQGAWASKVLK